WADEDEVVPALLGDQGEADPGVAGRRLDDGAAGLQLAGLLGGLDPPPRHAVLHRAARVEVLDLGEHGAGDAVGHGVELHQRRVPDEIGDVFGVLHGTILPPARMTGALSTSLAISPRIGVVRWTLESGRLVTARELGSAGHRLGDAMGRARRARRIAQSAAYGGGFGIAGIGVLGVVGYGLVKAEALLARIMVGIPIEATPAGHRG